MKKHFLILLLPLGLLWGCSKEGSILPRYRAEKAFFKAGKLYQRILINPALAQREDYSRTVEAYRRVIGLEGQGEELNILATKARLKIAQLYLAQKDYPQAIDEYQKVLDKTDQDFDLRASVRLSIAQIYEETGDFQRAIEEYKCLAADYTSFTSPGKEPQKGLLPVPLQVPRLYRRLGKRAEEEYNWARDLYQGIASRWPQSPIALLAQKQIAISYADQGQWVKAKEALDRIVKEYPQSPLLPQVLFTTADIYAERLDSFDQALLTYQRILDGYPESSLGGPAQFSIGRIHLKRGQPEKARESFQKVIRGFPQNLSLSAEAQFGIGSTYEAMGKWDQALSEYRWVVDKYPNTQAALRVPLYLADYYSRSKMDELADQEYKRAVKTYQGMVEKSPKSLFAAFAQERIAQCYIHQKRWKEAISSLWTLVRNFPTSQPVADGYLVLGMVYESELEDKAGALRAYEEFSRRFPHHTLKEKVKKRMEELR